CYRHDFVGHRIRCTRHPFQIDYCWSIAGRQTQSRLRSFLYRVWHRLACWKCNCGSLIRMVGGRPCRVFSVHATYCNSFILCSHANSTEGMTEPAASGMRAPCPFGPCFPMYSLVMNVHLFTASCTANKSINCLRRFHENTILG